jgi:hypothetical protein
MIKLFAVIRKQSKYALQQPEDSHGRPIPFGVVFNIHEDPWYPLRGGPGGAYALCDVDLYAKSNGQFVPLPIHEHVFSPQDFLPERADDETVKAMNFYTEIEVKN